MSEEMQTLQRPDDSVEYARSFLKEQTVYSYLASVDSGVAEVANCDDREPEVLVWSNGVDYGQGVKPKRFKLSEAKKQSLEDECGLLGAVVWLFGPERIQNPVEVMQILSGFSTAGARFILASEKPWPGKQLCKGEFEEYTDEEMSALLVRSGFPNITEISDGPFFRLWEAIFEGNKNPYLNAAEIELRKGNWQVAEKILDGVTDSLGSAPLVREYALLVADCHTMANRTEQAAIALADALQLDPHSARALCGLGRVAISMGDIDSSDAFFETALSHQPAMISALCGRAAVSEIRGKLDIAFRAMKQAADLKPLDEELAIETIRLGIVAGKSEATAKQVERT